MYIFCELWSAVIINLLFWQYANHIFDKESAKRFYPFLGMVGNIGLILAGNVLVSFSDLSGVSDVNMFGAMCFDRLFQLPVYIDATGTSEQSFKRALAVVAHR